MSEIKTRDMRAGKRWQGASEIIEAMQAEIDDLRAALAERDATKPPAVLMNQLINDKLELAAKLTERDAEIGLLNGTLDSRNRNIETLSEVSAAQRKVLELALESLQYINTRIEDGWNTTTQDRLREAAITAIQEQLA